MPVGLCLERAISIGGSRKFIIDEGNVVADEDVVFDIDALANESVTRNLHVSADSGILLDFDESTDLGIIADRAAVEVDEGEDFDVLAQLHIGRNAAEVHRLASHGSEFGAGFLGGIQVVEKHFLAVGFERLLGGLEQANDTITRNSIS